MYSIYTLYTVYVCIYIYIYMCIYIYAIAHNDAYIVVNNDDECIELIEPCKHDDENDIVKQPVSSDDSGYRHHLNEP